MEDIYRIVEKAFANKVDKGGSPYIDHLLRVSGTIRKRFKGEYDLHMAAFLHDLLEDIPGWTPEKLSEYVNPRVVKLVNTLTHRSNESYEDYIFRLASNKDAVRIKIADLEDNMDIRRLPVLTDKDIERLKKYHKYYTYLLSI